MYAKTTTTADYLSTTNESTLIAFVLNGDHGAFSELVSRNQERLYSAMLRIAKSADLAEEIVQETFVQAYLKLNTFGQRAAFSTWLFRIAINTHRTLCRKRRFTASIDSMSEQGTWQPIDPNDSPESECIRAETKQEVMNALAKLNSKSREILVLRELDGLTYEEIGTALHLKSGTVRSQLSRARCKLLKELEAQSESSK